MESLYSVSPRRLFSIINQWNVSSSSLSRNVTLKMVPKGKGYGPHRTGSQPRWYSSSSPSLHTYSSSTFTSSLISFRQTNFLSTQQHSSPQRILKRSLFVKVDTTPNPDSMKFIPEGKIVLPEAFGTGKHFVTLEDAKGSKLVRRLLKIEHVTGVFFGREFISINKKESVNWAPLKPIILDAIMDAFNEMETKGTPIIIETEPKPTDTQIQPEDDEVVAMIKELLETRIRPAVQEDGGDIFYEGFDPDTGIVKLRMAGSCVGCPSSTATLRGGVENMLMHYIPEVRGIEQVEGPLEEQAKQEIAEVEKKIINGNENTVN